MSGEAEPRRSVRSTKGQHKALDLEQPTEPKKRGKKGKKAIEKTEEPEEEIIRCVCGATEQDEDSGEPWIACDKCGAWQHNVCMGMSVYSEDLPSDYFCEQCKPEDHKELLDGIAKGEKPWEARRKAYEEEQAEEKKKKKGSKKGKKRQSDSQEEPQSSQKSKASPAPERKGAAAKATAGTKRKERDGSQDKDGKATPKMRKVSETKVMPAPPPYNPPEDLPDKITELPQPRQSPTQALMKSLVVAVNAAEKRKVYSPADGVSNESRAERLAIAIERAVHDTHPNVKEYAGQVRTLSFNLKKNHELVERLLNHTLTPPMLATMTTEELASEDLQRETAEMKARAEKQSILITEDAPRMRRTHKGDEMVADESFAAPNDEMPSAARRPSVREPPGDSAKPSEPPPRRESSGPVADTQRSPSGDAMHIDTQHSPTADNFDIKKVFSSVKSPTVGHQRRPSAPAPQNGPGDDPDVDRLLEEDREDSPPYSPSEETDPDVVWRGYLTMPSVANFQATAKYAGGANLARTIGLPWSTLIPKRLKVAGRISEQNATEYLCGLRYSAPTDIVVASLTPATDAAKADFEALVNYFVSKKRYAVVGDKGIANVRDTYLIPVLAGTGNHPEFMLNLEDNLIPQTRTENLLLLVIVYRNEPGQMEKIHGPNWAIKSSQPPAPNASTPTPAGYAQRDPSFSAPAFSPTSPHGPVPGYPPPRQSQTPSHVPTPIPPPVPHGNQANPQVQFQQQPAPPLGREEAQQKGEALAREVLGPLMDSPTVSFLLPQAHQMIRKEWEVVRKLYEREPRSREDLTHLSLLLEKEGGNNQAQAAQRAQASHPPHHPPHQPAQQHPAAPSTPAVHNTPTPTPSGGSSVPHLISRTPIPIPVPPGMPASIVQAHQAAQNRVPPPAAPQS